MANLANGNSVKLKIENGKTGVTVKEVDLTPVLKGLPDFAENKEQVETTVLKSGVKTYIAGLIDYGTLEFTCNYDKETAKNLRKFSVEGIDPIKKSGVSYLGGLDVTIVLSDKTEIKYKTSDVSVTINAASSGSLMEMTVTTFVNTEIKYGTYQEKPEQ